jgi:hypothetical protein
MSDWQTLLFFLGGGLMVWLIVRMVRNNPGSFTKAALSKSIFTVGVLALILMGVIFFCVYMLKSS